jgi:hypothetical protein
VVKSSRPAFTLEVTSSSSPGSKNRDFAPTQRGNLVAILVHAGDLVAEIRKADAGYQPHIARADHRDAHLNTCLLPHSTRMAELFNRDRFGEITRLVDVRSEDERRMVREKL